RRRHKSVYLLLRCRRIPGGAADPGVRWKSLWNDVLRWGKRQWDDIQNHHEWHIDYALQLLFPEQLRGWRHYVRWADPNQRREPVRSNRQWRNQFRKLLYFWVWYSLQNHAERRLDDALQFLLPTRLYGRRRAVCRTRPGLRRE